MLKNQSISLALTMGVACFFAITAQAQTTGSQRLHGHLPEAVARFHLQPTGRLSATQQLNLVIGLPPRNREALDQLLQQLYDPASPKFRQYLTPEQFTEQFGPTEQDYRAVIDFAKANGMTVTGTHPNRVLLDVSGSVANIERVFHVTMNIYQHPKDARTFYAPDTEPSIDLNVPILHISGLDNYSPPHPAGLKKNIRDGANLTPAGTGSGTGGAYLGKDFRAAYVPGVALDGTGQKVGLLEFDGYYAADITSYEQQAGLANIPLQNILLDGFSGTPTSTALNVAEVSLDIEMAICMATNLAAVIVYEAGPGGAPNDVLNRIATDNQARQISSSWTWSPYDPTSDAIFQQFAAQGQSFFNASGDLDAYPGSISASATPADDPYITIVGGTTLTTTGPAGSYVSETVWNSGGGLGSSGGISTTYSIPSWQQGINMATNQGSSTMRNIPDVALTGDNVWVIYNNGSADTFVGTSCAAPLWAGFTALVNQQAVAGGKPTVGFINPAIYELGRESSYTSNFHDITIGNNTWGGSPANFYATPGYDLCTGWGTPNGTNLINSLIKPDSLVITPASGFSSSGQNGGPFSPITQFFSLTNSGTGSLSWSLAGIPSWLNVSSNSGTLLSGGSNGVTISLNSAASNLFGGIYTATVWFTNQTSQLGHYRLFILRVNDPLVILPTNSLAMSGPVGGPFNVSSQSFLLTNLNAVGSLNWSATSIPSWLNVTPASGTLSSSGSSIVTVSLNSTGSNRLAVAGAYVTNVTFADLTSGMAQTLPFTLLLGQSLVQNSGFETGDFTGWTVFGAAGDSAVVRSPAQFVHSGNYGAFLGDVGSLGYISQTLSTVPGQSYLLSLWLNNPDNTIYGSVVTPNQFVVNWNTNSSSTNTIFNQIDMGAVNTWTNMQFVVTATGTNTILQFGERNDPVAFGLDDVNVQPIPVPSFRSAGKISNAVSFTWNTLAGLAYQVQYSTNLAKTNWTIISTNTAIGYTLTATNVIGSAPLRFYRIRRLP